MTDQEELAAPGKQPAGLHRMAHRITVDARRAELRAVDPAVLPGRQAGDLLPAPLGSRRPSRRIRGLYPRFRLLGVWAMGSVLARRRRWWLYPRVRPLALLSGHAVSVGDRGPDFMSLEGREAA